MKSSIVRTVGKFQFPLTFRQRRVPVSSFRVTFVGNLPNQFVTFVTRVVNLQGTGWVPGTSQRFDDVSIRRDRRVTTEAICIVSTLKWIVTWANSKRLTSVVGYDIIHSASRIESDDNFTGPRALGITSPQTVCFLVASTSRNAHRFDFCTFKLTPISTNLIEKNIKRSLPLHFSMSKW